MRAAGGADIAFGVCVPNHGPIRRKTMSAPPAVGDHLKITFPVYELGSCAGRVHRLGIADFGPSRVYDGGG